MYDYGYGLSGEESALRETVRRFAEAEVAPIAKQLDDAGVFPADIYRRFGELGLLKILVSEDEGGLGFGALAYVVTMEELCRVSASVGVLFQSQSAMVPALTRLASADQRARYLAPLIEADLVIGAALTEPEAGSDLGSLRTTARLDGGEWVINGNKIFITNGDCADVFVTAARTGEEKGQAGISLILVESRAPGFSVGRIEDKMGLRASPTAELIFEDCRVPADALLGPREKSFRDIEYSLNIARLGAASAGVGIGQAGLEASLAYARERKQFGQRIFDFQAVGFMIAEMATRVHAGRLMVYHAARKIDLGEDARREVAMAKFTTTDAAMQIATDAVQVFGGAGYMRDQPVERLMRDAKIWQIVDGTNQIQRMTIGRSLDRAGA